MDDAPDKQSCGPFVGFDSYSDPTKLPPGMLSDGLNVHCKGDGYAETRPGTRNVAPNGDGGLFGNLCFWSQPSAQYMVEWTVGNVRRIASVGNAVGSTVISATGTTAYGAPVAFLDRVFWLQAGVLYYIKPDVGAASLGSVTTFSDGTAMPLWSKLVVQNFRLMAFEPAAEKLYTSQIGAAASNLNWVKTDNIRVGEGDGDPARALLPGQVGFVNMLCQHSCWQINVSDASVANWQSQRITKLVGCSEGRLAISVGSDVYFLSRYGIVNLGALELATSISPQDTISQPIRPYIDLIDWANIGNGFATKWGDLLLFALPLTTDTGSPRRLFPYSLRTQTWQPPWYYNGPHPLSGAAIARFNQTEETILCDTSGRIFRVDDTVNYDEFDAGVQTQYESWLVTRRMDHGGNQQYKQPFYLEMVFDGTTGGVIYRRVLVDGAAASTTAADIITYDNNSGAGWIGSGGLTKKRYLLRGLVSRYYEAAVQVWSSAGKLRLREAALSAFIDPPFYT